MQKSSESSIKKTDLYTLHYYKGPQMYFVKAFSKERLKQHKLAATLIYNEQVFTSSKGFKFPEHFLHIEERYQTEKKLFFVTEAYEMRLSEYLELKRNISEK